MSYRKIDQTTWTDHEGKEWPVPAFGERLDPTRNKSHAALRAFVMKRDNFTCQHCGATALEIPEKYDGRGALYSNKKSKDGLWWQYLNVDHIKPLCRGGTSHPDNLQVLCEQCNYSKSGKLMS